MSHNEKNTFIREPILISKPEIQTFYITTGYAWSQTNDSVVIYLTFKDAKEVKDNNNYTFNVLSRSIELNIINHHGVHHKFKLNYLYDFINPEKSTVNFKNDKIIIKLIKQHVNKKWQDLSMKSMKSKYHEMERFVKQNNVNTFNFEMPFKEDQVCSEHYHN